MRCHYDVLGVASDADTQTLRAAYKKCALKWHPDKNLDNIEQAKEEFQAVQQAFEVLSDPHERAWYDTHREAILKGGIGKDYQDDSINLFPYFSTSCYQGYGEDDKGFYAVYRELFHKIFAEDIDFDPEENPEDSIPTFGKSDSSYEEVVHPFYAYWENYCTTKSFVWLDEFDVREAPNRRVVRLMEKENKKLRERAKRQRNEEIRQLVRFVRKRDKRIEKHRQYLKEKAAENAEKVKRNRLRQMEERKREIAETSEAEWAKMHNFERELQEIENNLANEFGDQNSEEAVDGDENLECGTSHLYCVACSKIFKNEKSFANHESSKKHKENVAALSVPLTDDFDLDVESLSGISEEEDEDNSYTGATSKKKTKSKKVLKPLDECHSNGHVPELNSPDDDMDDGDHFSKSKKQAKKKNKKKNPKPEAGDAEISKQQGLETKSELSLKPEAVEKTEKISEKKMKRKQGDATNKSSNEAKDLNLTCAVCSCTFQSKNKLFNHLKSTGHSVHLSKVASSVGEKPEKSKNKSSKCYPTDKDD